MATSLRRWALFLCLPLVTAPAVGGEVRGTIVEMTLDKGYGDFVFIRFNNAPASPIACSVNGYWHFTLPLATEADKKMFAMLMTARATGSAVEAIGSGACNEFAAIESLRRVGF